MFMSRFNIDILILDVTLTTKRWKKTIEIQHHTVRNTTQNMVLQWNQEISYWIHHRETEQDNLSNQVPPHQDSHEKKISRWTKRSDLRRRAKKLDNIANHQYPSRKTEKALSCYTSAVCCLQFFAIFIWCFIFHLFKHTIIHQLLLCFLILFKCCIRILDTMIIVSCWMKFFFWFSHQFIYAISINYTS